MIVRTMCAVLAGVFAFGILAEPAAADHRKRYRKASFDPLTHTVEDVDGATPSRAVAELSRHRRLLACVRALPVDTKQLLELYYWHDGTAEELAEIYGLAPQSVRARVHVARKRLGHCIAQTREPDDDLDRELRELGQLLASGPRRL